MDTFGEQNKSRTAGGESDKRNYFELDIDKSSRNSVTVECSYTSYSCVLLHQLICLWCWDAPQEGVNTDTDDYTGRIT